MNDSVHRRERFEWIHDTSHEILSGVLDGDGEQLLPTRGGGDAMHATGEAAGRTPEHHSHYDEQPPPNSTLGYTYDADQNGQTRLCVSGRGEIPHARSAHPPTSGPTQTEMLRPTEPRNRGQHAQPRARPRQQGGGNKRRRLGPAI